MWADVGARAKWPLSAKLPRLIREIVRCRTIELDRWVGRAGKIV